MLCWPETTSTPDSTHNPSHSAGGGEGGDVRPLVGDKNAACQDHPVQLPYLPMSEIYAHAHSKLTVGASCHAQHPSLAPHLHSEKCQKIIQHLEQCHRHHPLCKNVSTEHSSCVVSASCERLRRTEKMSCGWHAWLLLLASSGNVCGLCRLSLHC